MRAMRASGESDESGGGETAGDGERRRGTAD